MIGTTQIDVRYVATAAAAAAFEKDLPRLARMAIRAILQSGKGLDIAHLQFRARGRLLAVCSRVDRAGSLRVELDLGIRPCRPSSSRTTISRRQSQSRRVDRGTQDAARSRSSKER